MNDTRFQHIKENILSTLAEYGVHNVTDDQALFSSGMLDSIAAVQILTQLEAEFGLNLADEDFDINHIDSLQALQSYLQSRP